MQNQNQNQNQYNPQYQQQQVIDYSDQKIFCQKHQKQEFTQVCYTCQIPLCNNCMKEHSTHQIISPERHIQQISQKCQQMEPTFQAYLNTLGTLNLKQTEEIFERKIQAIHQAKQDFMNLVDEYFEDVLNTYSHLCSKVNNLESAQQTTHKQIDESQFPDFQINKKCLEKIMIDLMNYMTPVYTGEIPSSDIVKPKITQQNYYSNKMEASLPILDDQNGKIIFHNIEKKQNLIQEINMKPLISELPYQPSYIQLPDNTVFFCGGVDKKGKILGKAFICNLSDGSCSVLQDMLVKRCGHSLVYVPSPETNLMPGDEIELQEIEMVQQLQMGVTNYQTQQQNELNRSKSGFIYVIGGRTNNNTKTKLCEKFNIEKKQWVKIRPLQSARSRASTCLVDQRYIYTFYGTNSFQKPNTSIERYDIMTDQWRFIRVQNHLPGFDMTHSGAVQINKNQIMILGGFRESLFFDGEILFNRKIFAFNIKEQTISQYEDTLPNDCIVQGQAFIHQNKVYIQGHQLKKSGKQVIMDLQNAQIYSISKQECQMETIIDLQGKYLKNNQQVMVSQQAPQQISNDIQKSYQQQPYQSNTQFSNGQAQQQFFTKSQKQQAAQMQNLPTQQQYNQQPQFQQLKTSQGYQNTQNFGNYENNNKNFNNQIQ
ncbi:hypothetical protein PPERSA_12153 [Pseudocohnilembus persalinus]|uniref:B box-type domain-containing protein n=1 Tax=Pseudocohnilembus persalinus TaxID=266149 RepID=A0A0V0R6U5_PSEPJ|nr:hypothetical protein PPERSA_12153 [Pseudocohnilembus persalinus]|eukprot:KRX10195.1 hypothetical protein PPERSA_12153 [Pseudocohnilembus persalinus]